MTLEEVVKKNFHESKIPIVTIGFTEDNVHIEQDFLDEILETHKYRNVLKYKVVSDTLIYVVFDK